MAVIALATELVSNNVCDMHACWWFEEPPTPFLLVLEHGLRHHVPSFVVHDGVLVQATFASDLSFRVKLRSRVGGCRPPGPTRVFS